MSGTATKIRRAAATVLASWAMGCAEDVGTIEVTTWGEEYIEQEIPAEDLADGWRVRFERFLVVVADVTIAGDDGEVAAGPSGSQLFDHTRPGPKTVVTFDEVEARTWEHVSFTIRPITADTTLAAASPDDAELLGAAGASMHVAGRMTRGDVEKTFAWTFSRSTLHEECRGEKDGREVEGAVVTSGTTEAIELTIHGDHFFYDDLQSDAAVPRGDAIAAADDAGDADGAVTLEELRAVPLVDIPEGRYGTGAADVDDLGAFVEALAGTIGHFRGEGECLVSRIAE